ncbi:efflux RND transporter periplasmic adaptor subunit [Rhodanobacter terrae]|uniref:Efflux RND transporter periplasmic adaptor subunit n=1 Tax=Rhodanobacter terrae TaxID=418647 RepID=A0ABW0T082_9GAMM
MHGDIPHQPAVQGKATAMPPAISTPSSHRGRWLVAAVCVSLAVAAVLVYRMLSPSTATNYVTVPVTEGSVTRTVTATGSVNPVLTIIVGSYVSGVIKELYCDFNTQVKKGKVCAKIDPRAYQAVVDLASADLANARAQLIKDQATSAYANATYARDASLVKLGYVSRDALDAAHSSLGEAVAQVTLDRAAIAAREASLHTAEVNLGYTDIASPVDGTVVSRNVTIGQTVAASFQTPTLFLIATDLTRMQVDANVSESDIGSLKQGNKASFSVESFPSRSFAASVVQVRQAPQTVQNVVTYDVVLGIDNTGLLLKPGMTATARIITDERTHVLRVPDQALRFVPSNQPPSSAAPEESETGTPQRVWKLVEGRPAPVQVVLGLDDDTFTEVLSGDLKRGDTVIVGEQRGPTTKAAGTPLRFSP